MQAPGTIEQQEAPSGDEYDVPQKKAKKTKEKAASYSKPDRDGQN